MDRSDWTLAWVGLSGPRETPRSKKGPRFPSPGGMKTLPCHLQGPVRPRQDKPDLPACSAGPNFSPACPAACPYSPPTLRGKDLGPR